MLSTFLELVGMAAVAVGVGLMWAPAGIVVGGLACILVGWLLSKPPPPHPPEPEL